MRLAERDLEDVPAFVNVALLLTNVWGQRTRSFWRCAVLRFEVEKVVDVKSVPQAAPTATKMTWWCLRQR